MEEEKDRNNSNSQIWLWITIAVGALILLALAIFNRHDDTKEVYKAALAKRYGVTAELLMQWGKKFCPWKVQLVYAGSKIKKVRVGYFDQYLGDPEERPKNLKDEPIWTKKDICKALFIEGTTLGRRIKEIETPKDVINMSQEAYTNTRKFPPLHTKLILDYMDSKGYKIKK